ncbi:helix-turn-helix transcriptional regulator [Sodalis sp. dw_96]|uniref:AraC family transcriptional regulator n=1 Tax=Sodalis sp. dw_96 TaxID=2719794 RepID=UPI001BD1F050|nr:helix-turn-helix transcriptional regulator [Sodalis sp. dw_96]
MNNNARLGEGASSVVRLCAPVKSTGESVSFISYRYAHLQSEVWHSHKTAQLTYASQGSIKIHTATGIWTLPPYRGLWIPAELPHQIHALGAAVTHNLYLPEDTVTKQVGDFCVILVSKMVHSLIEVLTPPGEEKERHQQRYPLMLPLLLHELNAAASASAGFLPFPRERRLRAVTRILTEDISNDDTLDQLSAGIGATPRTLSRLFRHDTGLTFAQWRQQLKVMESISLMAQGYTIEEIAHRLGYFNGSAFIVMFRKTLGETPQRYFNRFKD